MLALKTDLGEYRELLSGAALEDAAGNKHEVKDAEEVAAFLRAHPDIDFILEHGDAKTRELNGRPDPATSLLCGYVRFDSEKGEVVSRPQTEIS